MRFVHGVLAAVCLGMGCKTQEPKEGAAPPIKLTDRNTKGGGLESAGATPPAASTNSSNAIPVVLPTSGRIHSVNTGLRFVVIDYTLGGMPAMGSLLPVYRNNEKVGQIRLSGPEPRNGFVTGDVVDGFVQPDDEVRVH